MNEKAKAAVLGMFVGDALALGPHWEYDVAVLRARFGRAEGLTAPGGRYHQGKAAGDFTHYGDQAFVLLESLAAKKGFALEDFFERWKSLFAGYKGYFDGATKKTLERIDFGEGPEGSGSNSNDLAGAARFAPLLLLHGDDLDALVAAARAQTRMTHNNSQVLDSAEFFARVAFAALRGTAPRKAMEDAAGRGYPCGLIGQWVEKGLASLGTPSVRAIEALGQTCHAEEAFPATALLLASYPEDLKTALVECVMAGGDSAARGMLVGTVLGAALGPGAIPPAWLDGLTRKARILELLAELA
jgi:ADP-ribosylglycohydrolase